LNEEQSKVFAEIHELLTAEFEGRVDAISGGRLQSLLENDSQARRLYLEYITQTASLQWWAGSSPQIAAGESRSQAHTLFESTGRPSETYSTTGVMSPSPALQPQAQVPPATAQRPKRPNRRRILGQRDWKIRGLAAFFAVMAASLAWIIFGPKASSPVVLTGPATKPEPAVSATPVILDTGFTRLTLDGKVQVLIQAPAEYTIVSGTRIRLNVGRLTAVVPHSVAGFTVVTHEATITDLGTEFGVEAGEQYTRTEVFNGRVSVEPRDGPSTVKQILSAGQADRILPGGLMLPSEPYPDLYLRVDDYDVRQAAEASSAAGFARWSRFNHSVRQWAGLVAYYDFQPGSAPGGVLADVSGNGHDGRLGTGSANSAPKWTTGRWPSKQGLLFDSNRDQSVRIPSDSSLNELAKSITIAAWVKPYVRPDDHAGNIIAKFDPYTRKTFEFICFYHEPGVTPWSLYFGADNGDPAFGAKHGHRLTPSVLPKDGRWMLIAVSSKPGGQTRFYVNGELASSIADGPKAFASMADVIIGASEWGTSHQFNGIMDELALFNRQLTDEEIEEIYAAGRPE
jgi:ferric-dicitrate binding protein FerR (iron transport regulator)